MQLDTFIEEPMNGIETAEVAMNRSYEDVLRKFALPYTQDGPYLEVGDIQPDVWILDISIIVSQLESVFDRIIPLLSAHAIPFRIPVDAGVAVQLFSADFGYEQLGKVISLYPKDEQQASFIAKALIRLTIGARGADIPTDVYLGGRVYARLTGRIDIPFRLPKEMNWPFEGIARAKRPKSRRLFKHYLAVEQLKADVKGNVYKAIDIKSWWKMNFKMCIGKEGKREMSLDQDGRTIKDRLFWQYQVQKALAGHVPVPEVYDFFEDAETGNSYLWMELIDGQDLQAYRHGIIGDTCWWDLEIKKQDSVLLCLKEILRITGILHDKGYVHRDLTPVNFLVEPSGRLRLIDLELCYHKVYFNGCRPFTYGTSGFMAPEQWRAEIPTVKEDIYALGALMLCLITGLHPSRLQKDDSRDYADRIDYFIRNRTLSEMIASCLEPEPARRPSLNNIKTTLKIYHSGNKQRLDQLDKIQPVDRSEVIKVIQRNILSYRSGVLADEQGIWYSASIEKPRYVANSPIQLELKPGWHSGIAGGLYLMNILKENGFDLTSIESEIVANWGWLQREYLSQPQRQKTGLYEGSYGIAVSLASGIRSGVIMHNEETLGFLHQLLTQETNDISIARGAAGRGLAILYCLPYLDTKVGNRILQSCANILIKNQQKDGSWLFYKQSNPQQYRAYTGFSYGIAGIIFFLLEYFQQTNSVNAKSAAINGLNWLSRLMIAENGHIGWPYHPKSSMTDNWIELGKAGIIKTFLKGYEATTNEQYRELAEKALASYPRYILSDNLSLGTGIAGVGQTYLDAYSVTQNEEWKERADHIAQVLLRTYTDDAISNSISWYTITSTNKTSDLFTGNTGIIHFLLKYMHMDTKQNLFILRKSCLLI